VLAAAAVAAPRGGLAQQVTGGDFDICDYCGTLRGNTAFLIGRAGFGTNIGVFVLVNAASVDQDVDQDGFTPGVDFTDLVVSDTTNFVNVADPSKSILKRNFILQGFLNPLLNGFQRNVPFIVNIPQGTPSGRYRGTIQVTDTTKPPGTNPNGQVIRQDIFFVEIEVLPEQGLEIVQGDTAARADSLVIRGRAGTRASGVIRVANTGNAPLTNVRVSATDLRSESAVGLVIPASRISFSTANFSALGVGDTVRVTVTVDIPRGILGGRYRGELLVQGEGAASRAIPLIVIVTSSRGILFANNPVRGAQGDLAQIAFNGDPGTRYQVVIFDMSGLVVFKYSNTVFAGVTGGVPGTPQSPGFGADFAVSVTWPLTNGRGENVASGMYLVVVESTVNARRQLARDRLMVIR
jgi:hypothetical protein